MTRNNRSLLLRKRKAKEVKDIYRRVKNTQNLSDEGFAEKLGISRTTLVNFFNGLPIDRAIFHTICVELKIIPEKYYQNDRHPGSTRIEIQEEIQEETQKLAELEKARASRQEYEETERKIRELNRELAKYLPLYSGSILPGQSLLKCYRLKRKIGNGGFAEVWEADEMEERDNVKRTKRVVAVKILYPHHAKNNIQKKYFFEGARKTQELGNSNIVRIYDIFEPEEGEEEAHCYFTMQYINGMNIRESINLLKVYCLIFCMKNYLLTTNDRPISFEMLSLCSLSLLRHVIQSIVNVVEVVEQVSDAISCAHKKYITHGDVKPENILIESDESKLTAYVTDFSLFLMESETVRGTTGSIGSFIYASPECMGHPYQATEKSDIYSLGMTTIYSLLGTDLPVELFLNRYQFIDEKLEGFTPQFKAVLLEAIELDENKRFSSVKEFSRSLSVAWQDRDNQLLPPKYKVPLQINHSSPKYRIGKFTVTNTEFNRFVRAGCYKDEGCQWWSSEGRKQWEMYKERKRENPYCWPLNRERTEDESVDHQKYWRDERYNHPAQPVVGVSWFEAEAYCNWLQAKLRSHDPAVWNSKVVRLPTEAEWEYAARGNTDNLYTWGNDPPTSTLANFNKNQESPDIVGKHSEGASSFSGCHNMCGNVWEWCKDFSDQANDPEREYSRVMRGGCFFDDNGLGEDPKEYRYINIATRGIRRAGYRHTAIGFRIVVEMLEH